MGTELMRVCVKEENDEIPAIPPGFESFAAFTLKKVVQLGEQEESQNRTSCSATASISESNTGQVDMDSEISDTSKITKSLRRKPWINYGQQLDHSSEDESDSLKPNKNLDMRAQLPKGVIRGCTECKDCQKVMARWRPQSARKIDIEDAPVFYPTEEEFEDTLKYIASIRSKAEPYGICRIVPPPSWKPPCPLKEKTIWENSTFATRVQRVDKLQNRDSVKKMAKINNHSKKKRRKCMRMAGLCGPDGGSVSGVTDIGTCEAERFGFEPGPRFSLNRFQKYADEFKAQYFGKNDNTSANEGNITMLHDDFEPSVENIEGEYWRIVEKATEEIEVLYGADLETGVYGSGFPKKSSEVDSTENEKYIKSGWNLNNFPRLPGSVLSYEGGDISGVVVPWLYIGMCFSSFCWHVEDHHLYSLNYLHWGAPKLWYGVPGKDAVKLEQAMRKRLPDLFEEQPDLLHKLVTQLSPAILKSEGVPVYRCVQNSGEFVLTFPRAYHAGFNCGFNCAEAVNVAPVDWLPHGQVAIELYREQGRRTSISHDKLLLGAAREAVRAHWELNLLKKNTSDNLRWTEVCGKDGILAKALKTRVELESVRRGFLCNTSQALKMDSNFDATSERECSICLFDLHLSAAGCGCSPDKYACLCHAKQLCSCSWGTKFFLFRYDINELNILTEALEGKLSAIYRWAKLDLGLALTSISKDNLQDCKLSYSPEGLALKEMKSHLSACFLKDIQRKGISRDITTSTVSFSGTASEEKKKLSEDAPLKDTEASLEFRNSFHVIKKENDNSGECAVEKPLTTSHDDIILLSDDESEEEQKPVAKKAKESPPTKSPELCESNLSFDGSLCSNEKGVLFNVPVLDAASMNKNNVSLVPNKQRDLCLSDTLRVNDGNHQHNQTTPGQSPPGIVSQADSAGGVSGNIQNSPNARDASRNKDMVAIRSLPPSLSLGNGMPSCENKVGVNASENGNMVSVEPPPLSRGNGKPCEDKVGVNATSPSAENPRTVIGIPACSQNNLDRNHRQKGPRIAKVVRRINCNVEPLEFGVVLSGKSWCNNHAIFPKGFRSRVKYINILDPTNMCYYVSEILDSGRNGPLFMVSLEHSPNEVFVHVSVSRCWEMVRERVNFEITKLHKLGRANLPPLQPPGSLDGLEMFGFSSPAIVQAVEALDRNRVCAEYWDSRPYSRPQGQIPQHSQSKESSVTAADHNKRLVSGSHQLPSEVDTILRGLFKKANSEELHSLFNIIRDPRPTADRGLIDTWPKADRGLIARLLEEEIRSRLR